MFKAKRVDVSATDTLIGEGSVFEGNIKSEASLRVEGQMIGDIDCAGDVTIGESGKANSNIAARNIVIAGTVHGNVTTRGTLTLTGTGRLYGNTCAQSLVVSEGAIFQGTSRMETKGATADAQGASSEAESKPAQGAAASYATAGSTAG